MKNFKENTSISSINFDNESGSKLYQLIYRINMKNPLRAQIQLCLTIINSVIVFIVYMSLEHSSFFSPILRIDNQIIILIIFCSFSLILFQFVIGLLYTKQFMLKLQLLIYRNVLFPIAFYSSMNCQASINMNVLLLIISIISALLLIVLELLIGKQSYSINLVVDYGFSTKSFLLLFEIFLFLYSSKASFSKILVSIMITISLFIKLYIIDMKMRRSKSIEYTVIRIQATMNLVYSAFIFLQEINTPRPLVRQSSTFMFPLTFFLISAQILHQYSDQMKPISNQFFNSDTDVNFFLECIQYITDDIDRIINLQNQQITKTCLIPLYYQHLKCCKRLDCPLSHQLQHQAFNFNGNYKPLFTLIFKIVQQLFINIMTVHHENLSIKFALLKFYMKAGANKLKIMQVISQIQSFPLTWYQKLKIHQTRRYVSDIDVKQLIQSIKVQDSFQNFSQSISVLMKLLIQFWTQYFQDRVDFMKVLKISQKITPVIISIETQMQMSIERQNFSTIRIMRTYSDYARWIINNQLKSAMIRDYTNLLSKKMSQIHQINSISADIQVGLIAISLNIKKLGEIKIANNQASNIFNYNKMQFLAQNVNNLMPNIYGVHHNDFLKTFITNQNKKVNTDRRLLLGKKKQGNIFQIYLQLQKSVVTSSEEIIFISSIQIAKMTQACLLITCDEKGLIGNVNTTYQQIFQKSLKKNKSSEFTPYTNIQQIIPSFFDIVLDQNKQIKQSIQCYDNPVFGIIQIKFQINKICLKNGIVIGYFIKGQKLSETKECIFKHLSLTASLMQLSQDKELKGMKVQYSSVDNQYLFSQSIDIFYCGQFQSQFTIPYVKVQLFDKVLTQNLYSKISPQYDAQIKTIRFYGDHFQRVQQADSFQSEVSQQQKTTINTYKFSIMKQSLQDQENLGYKKFLYLVTILFLIIKIIWLSTFYVQVSQQKASTFQSTYKFVDAYQFRQKISQYILTFQAQQDEKYGDFFNQNKQKIQQKLINLISKANLPQRQKQMALKVAYLQQTLKKTSFQQLINDGTVLISNIIQMPQQQTKWLIFSALFGLLIILKLLFNLAVMQWHQYKIKSIFSLFLGLSQNQLKQSHKKCVQFLKDSNEVLNQVQQNLSPFYEDNQQSNQQSSQLKIKRFKNINLGRSPSNFLKLNVFTIIFLIVTALMLIINYLTVSELQKQKTTYEFISTVMPEYSTRIMQLYSRKKQNRSIELNQNFKQKYQIIEYKIATFKVSDLIQSQQFISVMFNDQCSDQTFNLPGNLSCETICDGVMRNGVSKAINYFSHRIQFLQKMEGTKQVLQQITQLSIMLYYIVQPKIQRLKLMLKEGNEHEYRINQIQILIFFVLLISVAVSNTIYQCNYPLDSIYKSLVHSKLLINLIPDAKKKTKNGYSQI